MPDAVPVRFLSDPIVAWLEHGGAAGEHIRVAVRFAHRPLPIADAATALGRVCVPASKALLQETEHGDQLADHCTTQSAQLALHGTAVSLLAGATQPALRTGSGVEIVKLMTSKQPPAWPHEVVFIMLHESVAQQLYRSPPHSPDIE